MEKRKINKEIIIIGSFLICAIYFMFAFHSYNSTDTTSEDIELASEDDTETTVSESEIEDNETDNRYIPIKTFKTKDGEIEISIDKSWFWGKF